MTKGESIALAGVVLTQADMATTANSVFDIMVRILLSLFLFILY